ncbi:glucose dehydrogenase [FAD, quinone]-like [Anabrus simplex]|uniref:glucose dehydrogenase [FAD, quinone]-like n=1 Tax=Anabrus simplex TaxID=316456 RepID=UPI0035A376E7
MGPQSLLTLCLVAVVATQRVADTAYPTIIQSVLSIYREVMTQSIKEPRDDPVNLPEYDFIIVGAGTAGCVLASRLTEIAGWEVLLLEAGREENFVMDIPIVATFLQLSEADWKYKTVTSDKACLGLANKQCNFPRGKVMGGSSVLNYMVYTRGNRRDYDKWEKLGNTGWGWDTVLKYFMKSEDITMPELAQDDKYHRTGGYLTISYAPYRTPLAEAWMEAGREMGQKVADYNGPTQVGFSYLQSTTKNGTRWSSSRAFLHPAKDRKNLHVKKRARVTKVLIDPTTKTAYGVQFRKNGRLYTVRAKREVILSAGAVNSPQLLMISGVGPKKHLDDLKIPVIQNLKVGYNLMDHIAKGGLTFVINDTVSLRMDSILTRTENYVDYLAFHQGPMSITGCEALAFYDFKDPDNPDGYPDTELLFQSGSIVSERSLRRIFGITDELYDAVYKPIENEHTWMVLPMLMRPKSKGRIMLRSADPADKPLIYHNYLSHPEDVETIIKGINKSIELSRTNAFQKFASRLHDIPIPGCKQHVFGSDQYWECATRHLTFTIYHQSGTCKMGPMSDKSAVVDPRLRVHGVKNLRVIDASIMPEIPTAHTNGPTFMIAEKGADMIKEDWGIETTI